jgi:tetratricopeptide (TPR) repeat protein
MTPPPYRRFAHKALSPIMSRWLSTLALIAFVAFAESPQKKDQKKEPTKQEEEQPPPDEDAAANAKVYSFNPLQAQKEMRTGEFYFKKGSYRAATTRFREATKWNPGNAEAWLRLGESAEKQNDEKTVVEAYSKYLQLQPEAKNAPEIKKKLEKLKHH